ncbi:MAG: twin-arginine translocase subunit TatB [Thermomonas sp.]|nr:twin-arginine translocase subunit TatB [Thermomonas sp.]MBK9670540.1 twin-arginine translocase subunit TatB [Thermomonas sp.]MBP9696316.1 twin-arginine translocase subunit TatB [Thermomonas sp.]
MFDFSFGEMLLVALVALVVLGPERLPKAARFTGLWVRKARAHWYSVKAELESELASEELRRSLQDGRQALEDSERELHALAADTRESLEAEAEAEAGSDAVAAAEPVHAAASAREPRDV